MKISLSSYIKKNGLQHNSFDKSIPLPLDSLMKVIFSMLWNDILHNYLLLKKKTVNLFFHLFETELVLLIPLPSETNIEMFLAVMIHNIEFFLAIEWSPLIFSLSSETKDACLLTVDLLQNYYFQVPFFSDHVVDNKFEIFMMCRSTFIIP